MNWDHSTAQHSQTIARVFLSLSHPLSPHWAHTTYVSEDDLEHLVLHVSHRRNCMTNEENNGLHYSAGFCKLPPVI